ncbi:MAG: ComEC/Rec2 family competence protein, partial [Oscillospiraceae bacterium]|nr:ComEC/Rec2 family competence protein [Oscillospiraceae bacterium]
PYSAGSIGLQLSFSATVGLILFTPRIHLVFTNALRRTKLYDKSIRAHVLRVITSSLSTTFGAILLTIPLTAIHFGRVAIASPITNLLTLWAVSIAFTFGMVASVLGFIFMPLGAVVAYPVTIAARYTLDVARAMATLPFASVYSSNTMIVAWLVYVYAMFITFTVFLRARVRQYLCPACLAVIALCVVLLITPLVSEASAIDGKAVTVLDVGQGQSIVITSGEYTVMIDCGSMSGERAGAIAHEFLMNQGRTTIDVLILTHFHSDHVNGVEYLLTRTSVAAMAIPDPDGSYMSHVAHDMIDFARRRGTDIIYVTETLQISLGDAVLMLYPPLDEGDENERGLSILSMCGMSDFRALVTGDMNAASERALLRFAHIPQIDMLVVGHHGSRRSTSEELLYVTRPSLAVISVGRNSFGHPTYEVLTRLEAHGIPVLRTDISGNVTVTGG